MQEQLSGNQTKNVDLKCDAREERAAAAREAARAKMVFMSTTVTGAKLDGELLVWPRC
jgi:hypothetical protein